MTRAGGAPAEVLNRVAAVLSEVPDPGGSDRCQPCWLLAHVSCERGECTCPCREESQKDDEPVREHRLVENRAGSSAQKAG